MYKRIIFGIAILFVILALLLLSIAQTRHFIFDFMTEIFFFLKENLFSLLAAFFLVKGKFVLLLFLKKLMILSVTGLSKRYLIEKVFTYNIKIHFLDHISQDIQRLLQYIKSNFRNFPIVKQLMTGLIFLGSLSFVGKFMGGILAMKVFIAKFWSMLLAIVLKLSTTIIYFFTDYIWGSWIAPILEIIIFSWFLEWLEKVPFLKKYLQKIYYFFLEAFLWIEGYLEKIFHIPLKRFFRFLTRTMRRYIYRFIGYKPVGAWQSLVEVRKLNPPKYKRLRQNRHSSHIRLIQRRMERASNKV
ncbi:MAG: hypothetical protein Q9M36_14870 [Sulfurovum sp.]|nr:hypothetical protein [Sulfurovum sp.]